MSLSPLCLCIRVLLCFHLYFAYLGPDNLLAFTLSIFGGGYLFATLWV